MRLLSIGSKPQDLGILPKNNEINLAWKIDKTKTLFPLQDKDE